MIKKNIVVFLSLMIFIGCSSNKVTIDDPVVVKAEESTEDLIVLLASRDSYIALKASEKLVVRGDEILPELFKALWLPDTVNRRSMVIQTLV